MKWFIYIIALIAGLLILNSCHRDNGVNDLKQQMSTIKGKIDTNGAEMPKLSPIKLQQYEANHLSSPFKKTKN